MFVVYYGGAPKFVVMVGSHKHGVVTPSSTGGKSLWVSCKSEVSLVAFEISSSSFFLSIPHAIGHGRLVATDKYNVLPFDCVGDSAE